MPDELQNLDFYIHFGVWMVGKVFANSDKGFCQYWRRGVLWVSGMFNVLSMWGKYRQLVLLHTFDVFIHPGGFIEPILGMGGYLMQERTSKSFRFLLRLWPIITCLLAMHSRYGDVLSMCWFLSRILSMGGFLGWYVKKKRGKKKHVDMRYVIVRHVYDITTYPMKSYDVLYKLWMHSCVCTQPDRQRQTIVSSLLTSFCIYDRKIWKNSVPIFLSSLCNDISYYCIVMLFSIKV